jgi:uncharacterized repeat protein (TIGR03943 family)
MSYVTSNKIKTNKIYPWLDAIALMAWGSLLLKYTITGQYRLLIHPNYFGLVLASAIVLLVLGIIKIIIIVNYPRLEPENNQHLTLFTPGFSSSLLLVVAIAGLIVPPTILTSQTALQRRVADVPITRSQVQNFRTNTKPESRSLIDWVRTYDAYPEPDAYQGQPAKISGFVLHLEELPDNYFLLSRFVITCCAVDAYPIGIPIQLETSRRDYPPDTWLEVQGEMITVSLPTKDNNSSSTTEKRQLVLKASAITKIPTPSDPYNYQ